MSDQQGDHSHHPGMEEDAGLGYYARRARAMEALLVETCWRMRGPSGGVFTCGIYQLDKGFIEIRVSGADDSSVVFAHALLDIETARRMAIGWRTTLIATATFSELLH